MSLTKIYNSKLYLTSSRKDKIHAAIENPINLELVQQISDYLDDSSKEVLKKAVADNQAKETPTAPATDTSNETNVFDDFSSSAPESGAGHSSSGFSSGGFSGGNVFDDFGDTEGDMPDGDAPADTTDVPTSDTTSAEPASDVPVEQNTSVTQEEVISAEDINAEEETAVLQSGIIKKLLNDQEDTSGVVRVDIDDTETWIYYNDKVNLNDIFDNVIALLKDYKYDMLKFSRLARTDNAVVFDIKE